MKRPTPRVGCTSVPTGRGAKRRLCWNSTSPAMGFSHVSLGSRAGRRTRPRHATPGGSFMSLPQARVHRGLCLLRHASFPRNLGKGTANGTTNVLREATRMHCPIPWLHLAPISRDATLESSVRPGDSRGTLAASRIVLASVGAPSAADCCVGAAGGDASVRYSTFVPGKLGAEKRSRSSVIAAPRRATTTSGWRCR